MFSKLVILLAILLNSSVTSPVIITNHDQNYQTTVNAKNDTLYGIIQHKQIPKGHHLFVGRCGPKEKLLHQENIILINDGKSQVNATIRINVEDEISISCIKIFDEIPNGEGGYPSFLSGGVEFKYIEFYVATDYGKGFHVFVQIFGKDLKALNRTASN